MLLIGQVSGTLPTSLLTPLSLCLSLPCLVAHRLTELFNYCWRRTLLAVNTIPIHSCNDDIIKTSCMFVCIYCFRACLAATIRSSGASQSTIKLVATNLIASSRLMGTYHTHLTFKKAREEGE